MKRKTSYLLSLCIASSTIVVLTQPACDAQVSNDSITAYVSMDTMITMRDGVRLFTKILRPDPFPHALPIILERTPYSLSTKTPVSVSNEMQELAREQFIFVFQNIRGRYASEGTFEMQRNTRAEDDSLAIDESTDAYDTIDWLVKHVPNNSGRVGVRGVSYNAWLALMAALHPHPALKAVLEGATAGDMFLGDDFHHNGAFRLSYGFEYAYSEEASKSDSIYPFGVYDTYKWYLKLGPLSNVNKKYFFNKIPTWNNFVAHPNYDAFWKRQSLASRLDRPTVPTLHVAGWWDQEDFYGPLMAYALLERNDDTHLNYLVVGPWVHGAWERGPRNTILNFDLGDSTGTRYRTKIEVPWFAYHLKGKDTIAFREAVTFQTGSNKWMAYDKWPPIEKITDRALYLLGDGKLAFTPPAENKEPEYDAYVSDPTHPIPYRDLPIQPTYAPNSRWTYWQLFDQRFAQVHPHVATWESETLTEDITVTGRILADIFASTSGSDCDWVVKLIDVFPEQYSKQPELGGYQLMIAGDVLRGRFRKSFEHPEPIPPNQVNEYTIDLNTHDHCFLKGHKIMVQVQSSWFPIIDMNPQTYVENIFEARESDFITTTQKVYHSLRYPSHLHLRVAAR